MVHPLFDILVSPLRNRDIPLSQFLPFLLDRVQDHEPLADDRPIKESVLIPRPFRAQFPNLPLNMRRD
jgi:hypothetical protein